MTSRLAAAITAVALGIACAGSPADSEPTAPATAASATNEARAKDDAAPGLLGRLLPARGPAFREVTIPAGTVLRVGLVSRVSSDGSAVEDRVRGILRDGVRVDGVDALAEGAELIGSVLQADRAGKVKGVARIAFTFTEVETAGRTYAIAAERLAYSAQPTKKDDATKIGIGAGAGAIAGAIAGGKKGAAIGTGLGAAAGTGVVLATRGDEIILAPGTVVSTRLTAPLTVRVPVDD